MASPAPLINPEVVIAFISFVAGPVAVVLVSNRRSADRAEESVEAKDESRAFQLFAKWAVEQTGKSQIESQGLQRELTALRQKVALLERTIDLLKQQVMVLTTQITNLGGVPMVFHQQDDVPRA